jgi:hypothetical protein
LDRGGWLHEGPLVAAAALAAALPFAAGHTDVTYDFDVLTVAPVFGDTIVGTTALAWLDLRS